MPQEFKSDFQMKCTKSAVTVEFKLTRIEVRGNEFKLTSIISRFPIFDHTHIGGGARRVAHLGHGCAQHTRTDSHAPVHALARFTLWPHTHLHICCTCTPRLARSPSLTHPLSQRCTLRAGHAVSVRLSPSARLAPAHSSPRPRSARAA